VTASIVIFAAIAAFLGLRLYAVLGKRTGHEQPFAAPEDKPLPQAGGEQPKMEAPDRSRTNDIAPPVLEESASAGLRAIAAADRNFTPENFVEGAKGAYRMILEAYWAGKLADVAAYMADDVREAFAEAEADRTKAGEILDNRLITIERAVIAGAELNRGFAQVTVRFDADIAAVTRDTEGRVTAGSLSDAVSSHDVWTFSREIRSADPNWVLTDTDEAA
jgi:predicted lipid-binding transport protein (Tim44 family)